MKYHIKIDINDDSGECQIDLTEDELLQEYIRPYLANEQILIKGRSISTSNIYRIKITESEDSIRELVRKIEKQDQYDSDPFSNLKSSATWRAIDEYKDVTTNFLKSSKISNLSKLNALELPVKNKTVYINKARLNELNNIKNSNYDFNKLIQLCNEVNISWQIGNYFSVIALVRTILHHVAPIFGYNDFAQIANNYSGGPSFKKSMQHLLNSSKNIADNHLHSQIKKNDALPNETQVDYKNDLDFLLMEIVKLTK